METKELMNVIVLGASGAGKSTLIKAISGTEVVTGVGEGNTQKIDLYESSTWPIRLIDTKGFEFNLIEQWKTIRQVKKFTKEQLAEPTDENEKGSGVDAVWYCVEGTSRRTFSHNIELMNKAIKGWKNIPVYAVITKSYSEADIPENIEAIQQAFAKSKAVNLKKIIPVVAEEYQITDEIKVPPKGIDDLVLQTLDCYDEAKEISKESRNRMILEQHRYTANAIVGGTAASAAVIGAIKFNFADSLLLVPLETGMTKAIFKTYKVNVSADLIKAVVGSAGITLVAKSLCNALKPIPIAGEVINGVVAGVIVEALGQAVIATTEAIFVGKIQPNQIDGIVELVLNKIKENELLDVTIQYLEKNSDKLTGMKSKDIFAELQASIKDKVKK